MNPEHHVAPQQHEPAPQPAPGQGPLSPIAQFECWGIPDGSSTILAFKKHTAVVYPGWLVLYRADHSEAAKIPLGPDLKIKYFFGFARIVQTNGQKMSFFDKRYGFNIGPIWPDVLLVFSMLVELVLRISFPGLQYPDEPGFWWRFLGLGLGILTLIIMAVVNIPQAKAFKAACYRAGGVAS